MNTKTLPVAIRSAGDRFRRRRGLKRHGKYLSPERATLLILFYSYTKLITAEELWRRAG